MAKDDDIERQLLVFGPTGVKDDDIKKQLLAFIPAGANEIRDARKISQDRLKRRFNA